jgi:predicted GNAT family acetyltransferase
MADPRIDVRDEPRRHRYEVFVDEEPAGFTSYRLAADRVVFLHTEVADRYEGHGVGSALARGVLDDARRRGLRVTPLCPFIANYISRHPENLDLVDDADRIGALTASDRSAARSNPAETGSHRKAGT